MGFSSKLYPVLCITYALFVIAQFVINGLSSTGPDGTIFHKDMSQNSDDYISAVTPAGWTFSIWGFIYAWQGLWLVYALVNICRKGLKGRAYANPMFLPLVMFVFCIFAVCLNITWLITFDREEIEVACAALIAYALLMWLALFVAYRAMEKSWPELAIQGRAKDIWLTKLLVHNGLAIQGTWVTIASLLNVAIVMVYSGDKTVGMETAGTVVLAILSGLILLYVVLDFFVFDKYSRYTVTPYIVVLVALVGSFDKNYTAGARNSIFTAVLLAISAALLLTKIIVTVYKYCKRQSYNVK